MPTKAVGIYEAKTNLSRLIERVVQGDEVVILKSGRPVAKLIGYDQPLEPRKPGRLKGKIKMLPGFDDAMPEFEKLFYGE